MNAPVVLTRALAVTSAAACGLTLVPGVLVGEPVMNGSARGTAVVGLLAAVALFALASPARTSVRAGAVVTGLSAYLLYNAVMFAFATPFNRAFLLYEVMLGLAVLSVVVLGTDLGRRVGELVRRPPRWVAAYFWVVALVGLVPLVMLLRSLPEPGQLEPTRLPVIESQTSRT